MSQPDFKSSGDTPRIVNTDLNELIKLFYSNNSELGEFSQIQAEDMPKDAQTLLAHHNHMTVTVENFHQSLVDVQVVQTLVQQDRYAREILLQKQSDGVVVQYGIMRVDFQYLPIEVQTEIKSQQTPLGRVLIEHNVLREVQLHCLWKVAASDHLKNLLQHHSAEPVYGRTALIYCNGQPAIELLEIVTIPTVEPVVD